MHSFLVHTNAWLSAIHEKHQINPLIFAALYFVGVPPFWYVLYRAAVAIRKGKSTAMLMYIAAAGLINIAPFLYILVFGRNLPVTFWIILAVIVGILTYTTATKIRGVITKKQSENTRDPGEPR